MTTTDKRTAVEAAIKKACDDIMELVNGCVCVLYRNEGSELRGTYHGADHILTSRVHFGNLIESIYGKDLPPRIGISMFEKKEIIEILGRPITLEDVLRAMREKVTLHAFEQFSVVLIKQEWHLGKPLSDQPDPVIEFLYPILCNNDTGV